MVLANLLQRIEDPAHRFEGSIDFLGAAGPLFLDAVQNAHRLGDWRRNVEELLGDVVARLKCFQCLRERIAGLESEFLRVDHDFRRGDYQISARGSGRIPQPKSFPCGTSLVTS